MKNKLSFLMLLAPIVAQADVVTVKSSLWVAPFQNAVTVSLISQDQTLAAQCTRYQSQLFASDGSINNPYDSFLEDIRSQPSGASMARTFQTTFKISMDTSLRATNVAQANSTLFPVAAGNLGSSLARYEFDTVALGQLNAGQSKFIRASDQQNLPRGTYKLIQNGREVLLQVNTRDIACDLLAGSASFTGTVTSAITPTQSDQQTLDAFYLTVQSQLLDVLQKTETDQSKAIRIGYRLGEIISPSTGYNADTENSVLGLFGILFDSKTLNRSQAWSNFQGPKLVVSGSYAESKTYLTISN